MRGSLERARTELAERLRERKGEIEQAALTRVHAISDPAETNDPEYVEGLRTAVSAALDYGLAGLEADERRPPAVPVVLLGQARLAARNAVSLDTVLRRYFAGYNGLCDSLIEVAGESRLESGALQRFLRMEASIFDRLLAAVSEEHAREMRDRVESSEQRRVDLVERLLAGELLDPSAAATELSYGFEGLHLGAIACGSGAGDALRELARAAECRLLLIRRCDGTQWAWFGCRKGPDLVRRIASACPPQVSLASGEPGRGLSGWRLTHQQAKAALPIVLGSRENFIRYADVALLASMRQDDLLFTSLRELYLVPLERDRDRGETARETLRAYFATGCNASSAAATLGVNRNTVASRLRSIEQILGRQLAFCQADVEAALRLEELDVEAAPSAGALR